MDRPFRESHDTHTASFSCKVGTVTRGLRRQVLSLIGLMAMLGLAGVAGAAEMPRLRIRTAGVNAHHLIEDANGKGFFMVGICPPNLNMAYVNSVDEMVTAAGSNGVYLFLDPMNEPGMEWAKHNQADCVAWGRFWGDRYAKYPHVNILMGSDDVPQPQSNWIVSGLKRSLSERLFCIDQAIYDPKRKHDKIPNPWWQFVDQHATWINLWGWYVWEAPNSMAQTGTYQCATWLMDSQAARWGIPPAPTFIVESEYTSYPPDDGEGTGKAAAIVMKQGNHALRRQLWSVPLGGGSGFGIIGNINDAINDSMTALGDPSLKYVAYCKSFFTSRPWEQLEPDSEIMHGRTHLRGGGSD